MKEKPEAIMINIPRAFFSEHSERAFRKQYELMGLRHHESDCFYHFISSIPVHRVTHAYVCFDGAVQYKAIVVDYLRNQAIDLPGYQHPARNWLLLTGPVIKAPGILIQKGFRGFRYTKTLF